MTGHPLHGLGGLVGPGPQGPVSSLSGGSTAGPGTQQRRASTLRNARFDEKARQASFAKKCSWRCVAIFFVVLALILSAALAYITGESLKSLHIEAQNQGRHPHQLLILLVTLLWKTFAHGAAHLTEFLYLCSSESNTRRQIEGP